MGGTSVKIDDHRSRIGKMKVILGLGQTISIVSKDSDEKDEQQVI